MTKKNFNRIMAGLEEVRRHAAGEVVPGMVIHKLNLLSPQEVAKRTSTESIGVSE